MDRQLAVEAEEARQAVLNPPPAPPKEAIVARAAAADPALMAQALADANREKERASTTRTQIDLMKKEIADRAADRQRISEQIADYQRRVEKLPNREQEMATLTRDYTTSKANYQSLLDRRISAGMSTNMERSNQSERFRIADPAAVPTSPIRPRRVLYSALGSAASLVLGLIIGLLLELRAGTVLGEWEFGTGTTVMGRVPRMATLVTAGTTRGGMFPTLQIPAPGTPGGEGAH